MSDVSHPYPPLPPAPSDFTLDQALTNSAKPGELPHVGKLTFPDQKSFTDFVADQRAIGGTPTQLAVLHAVETTGKLPDSGLLQAAPHGTNVNQLLDTKDKTVDSEGFVHLGSLLVLKEQMPQFAELQRGLAARNPEALNALYHMEHAPQDVKFHIQGTDDRNDRFEPGENAIYWNPNTTVLDYKTGHLVPPDTAALHEEIHWAGRDVGPTLQGMPDGAYTNREEQRVIDHAERRDMHANHMPPRGSHEGYALPAATMHSKEPSLTATVEGRSREVHGGYSQGGKVIDVTGNDVSIATRGDGSNPAHRVTLKVDQLATAMGAPQGNPAIGAVDNTKALLADAKAHGDHVSVTLKRDGRLEYDDPAQQQRLGNGQATDPPMRYPNRMETEPALRQEQQQAMPHHQPLQPAGHAR